MERTKKYVANISKRVSERSFGISGTLPLFSSFSPLLSKCPLPLGDWSRRIFACLSSKHECEKRNYRDFVRTFCAQIGLDEARDFLDRPNQPRNPANSASYACHLQECGNREDLREGKRVHAYIIKNGLGSDLFLCNHLIQMYNKCGSVRDARQVFDKLPERNLISWTVLISGYARNGHCAESMILFQQMLHEGLKPNKITFISILNACASLESLTLGKMIHAHIIDIGIELDVFLGTALFSMYGKCGSVEKAITIFNMMPERNLVSWNAMISGYARHRFGDGAFKLFQQMKREGLKPNKLTCITILNAFACPEALPLGKLVHAFVVESGMDLDVVVVTSLISMYSRCRSVGDARELFNKIYKRDVVSWNAMIACYTHHGYGEEAVQLFHQMQQEGVKPSKSTFISLLNACGCQQALALGKMVHAQIVDSGIESDVIVGNALVCMYGKCRNIKDAWRMLNKIPDRDVVTWSSIIKVYLGHGNGGQAFKFFQQMQQEGVKPNKITFMSLLNACDSPEALPLGKLVHAHIVVNGFESDPAVGNSLISMYSKCGSINDACEVFKKMPERDVVSWNAMISGYFFHEYSNTAFKLFQQMQQVGEKPNEVTFITVLDACASLSALAQGRLIHAYIIDRGMESDIDVGTALISMYGKCGSIQDARIIFDKMAKQDVVSWSAIIGIYAQHGCGKEAIELFEEMQSKGVQPNEVTWMIILSACSHAGLVDEGLYYFNSMSQDNCYTPTVEHYNCMVDLLGRAGRLDEAEDFIKKMPFRPNAVTWMTLLGSCRVHGCIERGKHAAESILQLNPHLPSAYVVLSNTYAAAGQWNDVVNIRKVMADRIAMKEFGDSCIEGNNMAHEFVVNYTLGRDIYAEFLTA